MATKPPLPARPASGPRLTEITDPGETARRREEEANRAAAPAPAPASDYAKLFAKGYTPEERAEQARKGADFMREIAERDRKRKLLEQQ